jgi:hypothetical protein
LAVSGAAQVGFVDHVVVQQGGGVNELDDGGQFQVIFTLIAQSRAAITVSMGRIRFPPALTI